MKKNAGSFMAGLVAVIAVILLCGAAYLAVSAIKEMNIAKGEAFIKESDYASAIEVFKKADKYSLRPDARVIKGLASASLSLEDYENAGLYYTKLLTLEPANVDAHFTMGLLYIKAKDYGSAEKEVKALRDIGTDDAVSGAEQLSSQLRTGMVKGFFRDLLNKVVPGLPAIPGLTEEAPISPDSVPKTDDSKKAPVSKDASESKPEGN